MYFSVNKFNFLSLVTEIDQQKLLIQYFLKMKTQLKKSHLFCDQL